MWQWIKGSKDSTQESFYLFSESVEEFEIPQKR